MTTIQPNDNVLTVQKEDGTSVTYNPCRLYGVSVYRELEREFAVGDRLSFTAPSRELGVANRDLGTVERIQQDGQLGVRMDNGKAVSFDPNEMRHSRFAYVSVSRASHDAQIYTNDALGLAQSLSYQTGKSSSLNIANVSSALAQIIETGQSL